MNIRVKAGAFLLVCVSLVITSAPAKEQKPFTDLNDCRLVKENGNDGDSFSIVGKDAKGDKKKHVIRLYGVDCMETNANGKFSPGRLKDQGLYFGIHKKDIARNKFKLTLELGNDATKFTHGVLRKPFTVRTKFVPAMGIRPGRIYAYVITSEGEDLGELLVKAGLARVYGWIHELPETQVQHEYRDRLIGHEALAISSKSGAWRKTDWSEFEKERAEYLMYTSKLYINRIENNAINVALISERTGVKANLVMAIFVERGNGSYKSKTDLAKRVNGVGKKTADDLAEVLLFD